MRVRVRNLQNGDAIATALAYHSCSKTEITGVSFLDSGCIKHEKRTTLLILYNYRGMSSSIGSGHYRDGGNFLPVPQKEESIP
jgi:hypothetical protein